MARLIGLTAHLVYWQVFGHVNPKQIEFDTKRQMFVNGYETLHYLRSQIKVQKTWVILNMPLILVCLRMLVEFYFRNNYKEFFSFKRVVDVRSISVWFTHVTRF